MTLLQPNFDKTHAFITSYTGRRVPASGWDAPAVDPRDFIHSCATSVRWGGHIRGFYSIAEHQLFVQRLARIHGEDDKVQRCCVLHDAHEAFTRDFPSPWKAAIPGLKDFEVERFETPFRKALGLPDPQDPVWVTVKHYDIVALHAEARYLFNSPPDWINYDIVQQAFGVSPEGWDWRRAEAAYTIELTFLGYACC